MSDLKSRPTDADVDAFIESIDDEARREDCRAVMKIMKRLTRAQPRMWGPTMVGFGQYHYKYDSGREGDWFMTGFSPRKANLTLYIMAGFDRHDEIMGRLGKFKTGKSCLYVKRLSDVDAKALEELLRESVAFLKKAYG